MLCIFAVAEERTADGRPTPTGIQPRPAGAALHRLYRLWRQGHSTCFHSFLSHPCTSFVGVHVHVYVVGRRRWRCTPEQLRTKATAPYRPPALSPAVRRHCDVPRLTSRRHGQLQVTTRTWLGKLSGSCTLRGSVRPPVPVSADELFSGRTLGAEPTTPCRHSARRRMQHRRSPS